MNLNLSSRIPDEARDIAALFPAPNGVVGDLFVMSQECGTTQDDLVNALSARSTIAGRLVRLANCSLWGPSGHSNGLVRAIQHIGSASVPYATLAVAVANALPESSRCPGFDMDVWKRRAWTRAIAAQGVARLADASFAAEVFACGFLDEIGQVALAGHRPEEYAKLLAESDGGPPSVAMEREAFGFDRIEVNAALFECWRVPAYIELLHRLHTEPDPETARAEELESLVEALHIAELTVALFEGEDKGVALTRIEEAAAAAYDLPPEAVYEFVSNLDSQVQEVSRLFRPSGSLASSVGPRPTRKPERSGARAVRDAALPPELEHRRMLVDDPRWRDDVCDAPNREAFERFLDREIQARLSGLVRRPLCVVVLNVEGFAQKHRGEGEEAAREWLREACGTLAARVRRGDLFARLGGSYFGICMSEADPHAMECLADRLLAGIDSAVRQEEDLAHSLSVGGACLAKAQMPDDGRELLRVAVRQLKRALEDSEGSGVAIMRAPILLDRAA